MLDTSSDKISERVQKLTPTGEDNFVMNTWASQHSLEMTNTVKDGWRCGAVKTYGNDPMEMERTAAELIKRGNALADMLNVGRGE